MAQTIALNANAKAAAKKLATAFIASGRARAQCAQHLAANLVIGTPYVLYKEFRKAVETACVAGGMAADNFRQTWGRAMGDNGLTANAKNGVAKAAPKADKPAPKADKPAPKADKPAPAITLDAAIGFIIANAARTAKFIPDAQDRETFARILKGAGHLLHKATTSAKK